MGINATSLASQPPGVSSRALASAMRRRDFLGASAAATLAHCLTSAVSRPNILFAISDDQSFAHTGGFRRSCSPHAQFRPHYG